MISARFKDSRTWLLLPALALVVVALFLPRVELKRNVYDIVAIIDVTGSMNVRDLELNGNPAKLRTKYSPALNAPIKPLDLALSK